MSRAFKLSDFEGAARDKVTRAALGQPSAPDEKSARIREVEEQRAVVKIFREAGCKVYTTSEPRRKKSSAGVPDLWVVHMQSGNAWWFETKRQVGGVVSELQQEFAAECWQCGVYWFSGDRHKAAELARSFVGPRARGVER
jgi:hypothetical protein